MCMRYDACFMKHAHIDPQASPFFGAMEPCLCQGLGMEVCSQNVGKNDAGAFTGLKLNTSKSGWISRLQMFESEIASNQLIEIITETSNYDLKRK